MTRVVVPDGALIEAVPPRRRRSPVVTNRSTRYRFDLLDSTGLKFGELDGVSSGSLEWNANSQVKGGGKIVVSKANDVHQRDIRVVRNYPVLGDEDWETDTAGWGFNPEFTNKFEAPASVTRNTSVFYEGAASLDVTWKTASTDPAIEMQNCVGLLGPVEAGKRYTVVARIRNTQATSVYAKVSFLANVAVPASPDWQTIIVPFTAVNSGGGRLTPGERSRGAGAPPPL